MPKLATRKPTDQLAALTPIADHARAYVVAARSPRTREAYRWQWKQYTGWCTRHALEPMPARPETIALYLSARAQQGWKVATLSQALAAISEAHQMAGHESPRPERAVRETFKGIRRTHGSASTQKAPLLHTQMRALVEQLPGTLAGARNRALLLVGFAGAFRRSELVGLDVAHLRFGKEGLTVNLAKSKTDQEGKGRKLGIPYGRAAATCPVRSLQRWLELAGLTSGPVFRTVDKHGHLRGRLGGQDVARIVKQAAAAAGLDPTVFAGHSLRAGLATSAAKAGKQTHAIMKTTGHRSVAMVQRYIRDAELFVDNAVDGLL